MANFKFRNELTPQQIQLKELTKIWIDTGNEITYNRIYDILIPVIMKYFKEKYNDNGVFLDVANDVLLEIYNKRKEWKENQKDPNLQNYSITVGKYKMCNYIKHVNAKKRSFENISDFNKNKVTLDMDIAYSKINDKNNQIDNFCYTNNIYDESPETHFISNEKELAQDELLQKCIKYIIDLQEKKKNNTKEQKSLNIFMDFFNETEFKDILRKHNLPDDIKSNQYVQHIFYRHKQRLKNVFQGEYDEIMSSDDEE